MPEQVRRMLFIGLFLDPEWRNQTAGCTVSQCLADTDGLDRQQMMNTLDCDGEQMDRWIEAGRRFV